MTDATPLLRMTGISKRFPGVVALDDVALEVRRGEVHALLGENGAGKSTLLKILSGAHLPDTGEIVFDGAPVSFAAPYQAQEMGVVTIYQEFNLIPTLSVAENVMIGREPGRAGFVNWPATMREAKKALDRLGLKMDARRLVRDLSVADQQMVEIARALSLDARLIIMDEPTAALSAAEVDRLLDMVRSLKAHGVGIIYVTHRLDEVIAVCDRATVLRDGKLVGTTETAEIDVNGLIKMMVGRDLGSFSPLVHDPAGRSEQPMLRVANLSTGAGAFDPHATTVHDVSLDVYGGEILGVAGLVGAGRTEFARALFGADPKSSGEVLIEGRSVNIRTPADAIAHGIGLVPEDRKQQALFLSLAVRSNIAVASMGRRPSVLGLISDRSENQLTEEFRRALGIRMTSPEQPVGNLSGGNQQKVVLARWLALKPKILIVDEPTRGIDVAAKAEVHQLLGRLAQDGIAVIVISSELPEVMALSDRIVTLCEGRLTGELSRAEATEERLMQLMTRRSAAA